MRLSLLISVLWLPLAACAEVEGNYPTLSPRAVERTSLAAPEEVPVEVAPVDAATRARFEALLVQAQTGETAFRAALTAERARVTAGLAAPAESERWADAQEALSRIEAARAPTLAALEALDAEREAAPGELPLRDETWERVAALSEAQARTLAELQGGAR